MKYKMLALFRSMAYRIKKASDTDLCFREIYYHHGYGHPAFPFCGLVAVHNAILE